MKVDKEAFLKSLRKEADAEEEGEGSEKKEAKELDPIEVLRLALHDPELFASAFENAVRYCMK